MACRKKLHYKIGKESMHEGN